MLGDVGVMATTGDDRCTVALFEEKVEQGYKLTFFEDGGKCGAAFPVMAKAVAWRVYTDGRMVFADEAGKDLIIFETGKGFKVSVRPRLQRFPLDGRRLRRRRCASPVVASSKAAIPQGC